MWGKVIGMFCLKGLLLRMIAVINIRSIESLNIQRLRMYDK